MGLSGLEQVIFTVSAPAGHLALALATVPEVLRDSDLLGELSGLYRNHGELPLNDQGSLATGAQATAFPWHLVAKCSLHSQSTPEPLSWSPAPFQEPV